MSTFASPHRISRFVQCGAYFWVMRKRDDHRTIKFVRDSCHDRFCEACGQARRQTILRNAQQLVAPHPHRFLTLTIRTEAEPLTELIDRLLRCFKKLRTSTFWREKVRGGAAFVEVTASEETGHWHPHLHVILDGKWLEQYDLRKLWLRITGDSYVVDIRLIRNPKAVSRYVSKYSTKPLAAKIVAHPYLLEEAIDALRGRKMCYTFGTWSRWCLLKTPTDDSWETYCHSNELPFRVEDDGDYAHQILQALHHHNEQAGPTEFEVTAFG